AAGPLVSATELNFTNSTNDFSAAGPSNAAMTNLEDFSHNADDVGAEADSNNMESIISVSLIPTTRIHKDHPTSQIIGDLNKMDERGIVIRNKARLVAQGHTQEEGIDYEEPLLGLWYPKDSPFDLVAYSDSNYAGGSLDRKSTTGGCHFLGCRLISWQCKKQTVVATSSTEAEYVAAASGFAQVL
nr:putative ribonuclease H-like domain-containing protein [Tanacetum cinerariifolium]